MARRRHTGLDFGFLIKATVIATLVWFLFSALSNKGGALTFLVVTVIGAVIVVKAVLPQRRREALLMRASAIVERHEEPLAKRHAQLVCRDPYGRLILDKWHEEIDYFISHHIRPTLTVAELETLANDDVRRLIVERIGALATTRPAFADFSNVGSPAEFEAYGAEQLRLAGWRAHVTSQSRDQGVDVIVERQGVRVVLQCKLYSNPVGNKAVQEAVAAREHERANYGVVVTNNRYTSAAEQLATTNRILLIHHSELPRLHDILAQANVA